VHVLAQNYAKNIYFMIMFCFHSLLQKAKLHFNADLDDIIGTAAVAAACLQIII